ncbi:MAG: hypothetical protein ACI4I5_06350 [Acutalibacteraceae bacterium]
MKKVLALVLVLALAAGCVALLTSCGGDKAPETTAPASEVVTDAPETTAFAPQSTEEVSDTVTETAAATEATTETTTATTTEATTTAATTKATTTTAPAEMTKASVPTTKKEIVKTYNDAVNGAISAKAGYSKTRVTTVNQLEGGAVLKIKAAADAVKDFLGEGTKTYTNNKGKSEYMSKSNLSESDVTSATCTEKNGKYTITMTLKDGSNSASEGAMSDNSPLNRCGLYVGNSDKSAYDYKTTENIYKALNGLDEASVKSGTGKTSNAKITAVIDAETGKLEKLDISFNFSVVLNEVKYLIAKISTATGSATTTVKFDNFKY